MKKTTNKKATAFQVSVNGIKLNPTEVKIQIQKPKGKVQTMAFKALETVIEKPTVEIAPMLAKANSVLFLNITHSNIQTLFDLTALTNLVILSFDEELNFNGINMIGEKSVAPFQILNQGRFVLVIKPIKGLDYSTIKGITV